MNKMKIILGIIRSFLVVLLILIVIFVFIMIATRNEGKKYLRYAFEETMREVLKQTYQALNKYKEDRPNEGYPVTLSILADSGYLDKESTIYTTIGTKKLKDHIFDSTGEHSIKYKFYYTLIDKDHFCLVVKSSHPSWSIPMPTLTMKEDGVIERSGY